MTGKKQFYSKKLRGKVQEFLNVHNLLERRAKRVKLVFIYFLQFFGKISKQDYCPNYAFIQIAKIRSSYFKTQVNKNSAPSKILKLNSFVKLSQVN